MKNKLNTIDGDTLMNTPLPPPKIIASSLIPEGLAVFGGAAKIGKSWLMLWLCLKVARGEKLWNFETTRGTTLYLCLEDSYQRIQSRLAELTDDAPENTHFATMAGSIGLGLEEHIESFMTEHPDTVLIIIDTLQKVRRESGFSNQYGVDYSELGALQELAKKYHICIMVVHHLRKLKDVDTMNMLSGTTGVGGAADTIYVLDREKRTENKAKLFCTGRDIESLELLLEFNRCNFLWELSSESVGEEVKILDEVIATIRDYFLYSASNSFNGTASELSTEILNSTGKEIAPAVISKKLLCNHF